MAQVPALLFLFRTSQVWLHASAAAKLVPLSSGRLPQWPPLAGSPTRRSWRGLPQARELSGLGGEPRQGAGASGSAGANRLAQGVGTVAQGVSSAGQTHRSALGSELLLERVRKRVCLGRALSPC